MTTYRIVRRAFSEYAQIEASEFPTYTAAILHAMRLEAQNRDGEYMVRREDQPDYLPSQAFQSGLDWL